MGLQARIFIFFALSLILSLILSVSVFLGLLGEENELLANPVIQGALQKAFLEYDNPGLDADTRLDRVASELEVISREASRFSILRKDLLLGAGGALALFCLLQVVLFALLAFFLSRAVTRPWARIYAGLRELESGNPGYRFPVGHAGDFSRLARNLNSLLDTIQENERRLEEQSNLLGWKEAASFLAHQFRNPLAAIGLSGKNLSLLLGAPEPEPELVSENLRILDDETQRLSRLMARLRELTSLEKLETVPVRLDDLFRKAAERYGAASARIRFSGESGGAFAFDIQYMEQAFFNLVNNSIEASLERGICPEISVEFGSDASGETVALRDTVTGLSPQLLEKLGQPRFTTKKTGTGLGIHFVRKIVSLHGGSSSVTLSPEGGLVFSLKFTRRPANGQHSYH